MSQVIETPTTQHKNDHRQDITQTLLLQEYNSTMWSETFSCTWTCRTHCSERCRTNPPGSQQSMRTIRIVPVAAYLTLTSIFVRTSCHANACKICISWTSKDFHWCEQCSPDVFWARTHSLSSHLHPHESPSLQKCRCAAARAGLLQYFIPHLAIRWLAIVLSSDLQV